MKRLLTFIGWWLGLQAAVHAEEHVWQTVQIQGNSIAFSCQGKGDNTLLVLAGMGLDVHASFKNIYHRFERANYQICMDDSAGMGQRSFAINKKSDAMSDFLSAVGLAAVNDAGFATKIFRQSFSGKVFRV